MSREIKKVGVIGAGTMGSGIAGQLANAGVEVVLLDKFEGKAEAEIERMQKAKPTDPFNAGLMVPSNAKFITPGTTDDNLELLGECDWIIETILAPHPIRQQIYKDVEKIAKPDAIFSSNTSTMQIDYMTDGQSDDFKSRFLNTHFFNPVRYMHLLEVITSDETQADIVGAISEFGSKTLGKKVVHCKDERGFIANRIGMYAMERARVEAVSQDMKIEDVDAIMGQAFGFPKLGLFKLADEVGLPVIEHVRTDLNENLPERDAFKQIFSGYEEIKSMIESGHLGSRAADSKGGYYRKKVDENGKPIMGDNGRPAKEARDLETGEYRDFEESPFFKFEKTTGKTGFKDFFDFNKDALSKKLKSALKQNKGPDLDQIEKASGFAWPVMRDLMVYVLDHAEELAYDLQDIDDAMRAGFNWEYGPFELLDQMGVQWFTNKLEADGINPPALLQKADGRNFYRASDGQNQALNFDGNYAPIKRKEGVLSLADIKAANEPLITHNSASLWDIGDGVVALEFHSTKNAIDPSIFHVINESIKLVSANPNQYKGMVIYNDDDAFSFGANLKLFEPFMNASDNKALRAVGIGGYLEKSLMKVTEEIVFQGQAVYNALNQAPFPVIGAPKGNPQNMAFGGAAEILMHCDAIQSGPEQIIALPEAGLALLPAWGGSTRYLQNAFEKAGQLKGPMPAVIEATMALANPMASAATCAQDAKKKLWLSPHDGVSMNPDTVLADAKAKALAMVDGYKPKPLPTFNLPGLSGKGAIRMNVDKMYQMGGDPSKTGINHIDLRVADALADVLTGGETIKRDDVDLHVADYAVGQKLKQIMDERGVDEIPVHTGIPLNISRMLQLERDRFLERFAERATWGRVKFMLSKGAPLREPRLDPAPSPNEIRSGTKHIELKRRQITGAPLTGADASKLEAMAEMTREFYKQSDAKTKWTATKQAPKTAMAARRALNML